MAKIQWQKAKTRRTQLTVGLNLIKFPGDITTPTAYITTEAHLKHCSIEKKMQN